MQKVFRLSLRGLCRWFFVAVVSLAAISGLEKAFAHEAPADTPALVTCDNLLEKLHGEHGVPKAEGYLHRRFLLPSQATVRATGSRPGRHGGRLLELTREGEHWVSNYRSIKFDPQGDPRTFIVAVGPEAARFFGFEVLDDAHCLVPDPVEFKGALAKINARLGLTDTRVPITFYQTRDNQNVKVRDYIRRFRDEGAIPLAVSGNHLLHDLSFHTGAIFLPPEVVAYKREQARFLEAFIAHLGTKYVRDEARARAVRRFAFAWRMAQTLTIDNGTGVLTTGLVSYFNETDPELRTEALHSAMQHMLDRGESALQFVTRLVFDLDFRSSRSMATFFFIKNWKTYGDAYKILPVLILLGDLREFYVRYNTDRKPPARPWVGAMESEGIAQLCEATSGRLRLIQRIAVELLREQGEKLPAAVR